MNNEFYLALAAVACLGFAGLNLVLNDGILLGWILLGVLFSVAAAAIVTLGDGDDANALEA